MIMKSTIITLMIALLWAGNVSAQKAKVSEKELVGAWTLESMQWKGEKIKKCGKEIGYTQFKYYGADGEYACAEIVVMKDGTVYVGPHEYGTYWFKDGLYSEMGRKAERSIELVDKNTCKGTWQGMRYDIWKKTKMPDKLVRYIVDCCKTKDVPKDMQQLIKQTIFK